MEENTNKDKKTKLILIIVGIIIYTIIVAVTSINIYKEKLAKDLNDIFSDSLTDSLQGLDDTDDITINDNNDKSEDVSVDNKKEEKVDTVKVNFNDTITKNGKYELTIPGYNMAKKILPPNTSGYYSYYEAKEDGHQYLDLKYNYKNLEGSEIDADEVASIRIKYDDKYEYTGFCVIEDTDGDFTYASITSISPLTTGKLHYLFDIPDEVANGTGSIVATITIGSDIYELKIR